MPNFKIFQDNPDQVRVKIYGGNDVAFNTDTAGNITITSTGLSITAPSGGLAITSSGLAITPPSGGLAITPPANGLSITATGLSITPPSNGLTITSTALSITPPSGGLGITPPANGLSITATGLAITPPSNGLTITSTALSITPPSGGLAITPPTNGLTITSTALSITPPSGGLGITPPSNGILITTTGLATAVSTVNVEATRANVANTSYSADTAYNVSDVRTWSFGVVNAAGAAENQALVKLQISPNGSTWKDDTSVVTINQNVLGTLVTSTFLKYARISYAAVNASSAVTLNIFFQGQN